ncbi:MAG: hypothetical protein Ct9H300mP6_04110 [Gammaproteobacteria bacterium]|nr:MAG: hypothetical protein Ct9H300mP6_04110 [Gammaproteobacteria bacterium]
MVTDHNFISEQTDVTGAVTLPEGTEMVMPGDDTHINCRANCADSYGGITKVFLSEKVEEQLAQEVVTKIIE